MLKYLEVCAWVGVGALLVIIMFYAFAMIVNACRVIWILL